MKHTQADNLKKKPWRETKVGWKFQGKNTKNAIHEVQYWKRERMKAKKEDIELCSYHIIWSKTRSES